MTSATRAQIYQSAYRKYREAEQAAALETIRAEVKKEVIREYEGQLRAELEKNWCDEKRDKIKKKMQADLGVWLSQITASKGSE